MKPTIILECSYLVVAAGSAEFLLRLLMKDSKQEIYDSTDDLHRRQ